MKCLILRILANFCLLDLVIDFSLGWSDSVSLRFHLDDLDLRCVLDSLGRLGPLLSWRMLSLHRHLEDFWAVSLPLGSRLGGHVCPQLVQRFAAGSCLETIFASVLCVLNLLSDFRDVDDLLHHVCFSHVDDLFNDSFRDSGHRNAANNFNDLLRHAIPHALLWYDLHNFDSFLSHLAMVSHDLFNNDALLHSLLRYSPLPPRSSRPGQRNSFRNSLLWNHFEHLLNCLFHCASSTSVSLIILSASSSATCSPTLFFT